MCNINFGTAVSPENISHRSSSAVIDAVVKGCPAAPTILPSQWHIDVEDAALLHLGALMLDDAHHERVLAFAGRYSWTWIFEVLNRRYPHKIMLESIDEPAVDAREIEKALIHLILGSLLYEFASRCYNLCFFVLNSGRYYAWSMIIVPLVMQSCSPHNGLIRYCTYGR